MKILLLGLPGSGKSTQGRLLSEETGWPWISTGELCRNSNDPRIQEIIKSGQLVDDETITKMFLESISGIDNAILDGFPRTDVQAKSLVDANLVPDAMFEIVVSYEELIERLKLRGRSDDEEEKVKERVAIYNNMRNNILAVLEENGMKLVKIDGIGTVEEVFERVKNALKEVE